MEKPYKKYKFKEEDLNEIVGYLKGRYGNNISKIKQCPKFKLLSQADKSYVLDEISADK